MGKKSEFSIVRSFVKHVLRGGLKGAGAARFSYDSSITNPNEFSSQLKKQMKQDYSAANDSKELEKIVESAKTNWAELGFKALKYGIITVGIIGGACTFFGNVQRANAEVWTDQGWYHWSPADFDGNFVVDYNDLAWLANHWLTPGDESTKDYSGTDINKDGIVNFLDYAVFANELGRDVRNNGAKMKARVETGRSEPGDEYHPWTGVGVRIHNISPVDTDYDMKEATFQSGSNNGVNYFTPFDDWDKVIDPNESRAWRVPGTPYIRPGKDGTFYLVVVGNPGEDPNSFGFKNDIVKAKTQEDTDLDFTPLKVDLPTRK